MRHALSTRLWHWINAAALVVLFMSGLTISNAHRRLYWGNYGFAPEDAWLHVVRFPGWATLPMFRYDLAEARDWHNTAAWLFAAGLLAYWIVILVNGHFRRDIAAGPRAYTPQAVLGTIRGYLTGENRRAEKADYNPLQRIAYAFVLGVFLPGMVLTGLAMSPGIEPAAPWLVEAFGGRQSARSFHFIFAFALLGFLIVHVAMVFVAGPVKTLGGMIVARSPKDRAHG
ncbi:cytochrome b/b6 domain-containing protein [Erythrobacter sp.]|jgi:Ni/Fe-hydrogenase b-type cytochrome subunit|uniref:cytochrome b/b6 domain-containing protein n=1 Tax=Erythrobacter sp. TaxID=1042 RepID=UPI002EA5DC6C|nr:cytochrome b/b6 domain-containing protein [Erythrobacter sp.]